MSHGICTSEELFDWFLTNVTSTTRLKLVIQMAENDECLPNFAIFGGNELLEISDNQDDDEMSLFIEENRNALTTKKDEK